MRCTMTTTNGGPCNVPMTARVTPAGTLYACLSHDGDAGYYDRTRPISTEEKK